MKLLYTLLISLGTYSAVAQSTFLPESKNTPIANRGAVVPITASISYQGYEESQAYFGEGEFEIFLDNVNGVLDKPIIILDGFDPGDGRDITGLYNSLEFNGDNIADIVRDEGFDIVILNAPQYNTGGKDIDGGSDYIQRNAMVLIEMIQMLNDQKVGDEELVILGPSMGGLIARYALSYMEQNTLDAETRLYISFDSPHRGANIPISLQYLINYLAYSFGDADAQAIVEQVLNSPAAKEMLIDHVSAHLLAGSDFEQDPTKLLPEGAPNFRNAFQGELDVLGFPQNVRNVTMVNGSALGDTTGTPGMQVVNTTLSLGGLLTAEVILHFTPTAGQTNAVTSFDIFLAGIPVSTFDANAEAFAFTDGVDASPGGTSNISAALSGGTMNPIIIAFIAALDQDDYSFIPLLSALAIDNEDDWYAIPDIGGIHTSPFVNAYIPDENEPHVTVTQESANFALEEIRNGVLGIEDESSHTNYVLSENPIEDQIHLKTNGSTSELSLTIYTMAGQKLSSQFFLDPSEEIIINHSLASGMYLLTLQYDQGLETLKMVVK